MGGVGFSVSGSAAIIFVGVMVAAGIAVPSLVGSMGALADSQGEQVDRGIDALNTEFEVMSATYNASGNDDLEITLSNTGSTTLGVAETSVLVNGEIPDSEDVTTEVEGDQSAELWLPGDTLTITVNPADSTGRIKVVAENGIAETTEYGG